MSADSFDPAVIVPRYEREIVMASWLYYHAKDVESPLTDAQYDQRVQYVCANWSETSPAFRKRTTKAALAASGVHLKASTAEKKAAVEWAEKMTASQ